MTQGNSTEYISDFTISQGGPISQDKLWFFTTASQYNTNNRIANTFTDDGNQGVDENYTKHALLRLTWQMSPRNKLGAYYDRTAKYRSNDMQSLVDPETASVVWTFPNYGMGQVKYTSTVSSKVLFEAGFAFNTSFRDTLAQEGHSFTRDTSEWFAGASRTTQTAGARSTAPAQEQRQWKTKNVAMASMSYVTGTHHVKVGMGFESGWYWHRYFSNADITQRYSSSITDPVTKNVTFINPVDVLVRNTPIDSQERMNKDLSLYAQDSWRLKRLTLNAGLRYESVNSQVDRTTSPLGRFVPERVQNEVTNVPDWRDLAPRFQAVYDLFGTSQDRSEVLAQPLQPHADDGDCRRVQRALVGDERRDVGGCQPRRHRPGLPDLEQRGAHQLRVQHAGMRAQPQHALQQLRRALGSWRIQRVPARLDPRARARAAARAPAGPLGERGLVPLGRAQPHEDREHGRHGCRLHADDDLQPDRRHADHLLQHLASGLGPGQSRCHDRRAQAQAELRRVLLRVPGASA